MLCIFEDSYFYSSRFLSLSLHFLTSLEIPIHLFGVYLIYTKTPKSMKSAKNSIMQLHIACSLMDLYISFFLVLYLWSPISAGIPCGLLTYFGVSSIVQLYMFYHVIAAVGLTYISFFESRYDALVIGQAGRSSSRNAKRIVYFSLNTFFLLVSLAFYFSDSSDSEELKQAIRQRLPCDPGDIINHPMLFLMNREYRKAFVLILCFFVIIIQGAYFVFYTTYHLFFSVRNVSAATQQLQKKFFIALALQVFIPMISITLPLTYYTLAWQWKYLNQMYNNIAMIVIGFSGLMATIVMILVHAPYRQAVAEMFWIVKKRKTSSMAFQIRTREGNHTI